MRLNLVFIQNIWETPFVAGTTFAGLLIFRRPASKIFRWAIKAAMEMTPREIDRSLQAQ